MHTPVVPWVNRFAIVAIMLSILLPLGLAVPVSAQGEECPEGLVYLVDDDLCVLPEEVPPSAEFIDQHTTDDSDEADEADASDLEDDSSDQADLDDATDSEADDVDQVDVADTVDIEDDGVDQDDTEIVDDTVEEEEEAAAGTIKNVTVLTYSCPINWDPATKLLVDSHDICSVAPAGGVNYSVLFEGTELITVGLGQNIDVGEILGTQFLKPGFWSIQETSQGGLTDPFAFCAIYAADGTQRMDVREFVPGGKLDILLAADEEVNCEWFSVAEVPETVGDPNALPIGSLRLLAASCPYATSSQPTADSLVPLCTEKGLSPVTYTATSGSVVSTQVGPTDSYDVDFQKGLDTRLLSGSWRISAT